MPVGGTVVQLAADELPDSAGDVDVGGDVQRITAGSDHTCALLVSGAVRCWGYGWHSATIGDDETPAYAGDVSIGATVSAISCGPDRTCAVLEDGGLLCWGSAGSGELGRGEFGPYDVDVIGDDETPDSLDPIALGDTAVAVELGYMHVCALTASANLRCSGYADAGALGVGQDTGNIGDNEDPSYWGPVKLL